MYQSYTEKLQSLSPRLVDKEVACVICESFFSDRCNLSVWTSGYGSIFVWKSSSHWKYIVVSKYCKSGSVIVGESFSYWAGVKWPSGRAEGVFGVSHSNSKSKKPGQNYVYLCSMEHIRFTRIKQFWSYRFARENPCNIWKHNHSTLCIQGQSYKRAFYTSPLIGDSSVSKISSQTPVEKIVFWCQQRWKLWQ